MIETSLVYEGEGRFRCADRSALELADAKLTPGQPVTARLYKPRSLPQHNWFFAMVQAAHDNQRAGPPFPDAEGLRKWLLIQAGWCHVMTFSLGAMTTETAGWLRKKYGLEFSHDSNQIYVREAKSIAFEACDADQMRTLADRVIDVICERIVPGTSRADWEPFKPELEAGSRPAASSRASARYHRPASSLVMGASRSDTRRRTLLKSGVSRE